jgi:multiple inositol-polyphosphate phosphatase/2,3-bisphosphoglycerate 3-phosphatase
LAATNLMERATSIIEMKRKTVFLFFVCLVPIFAAAQCGETFLGSKTLYKDQQQKYSPAPKGYQPVFINHVGRHGARHLTKDVNTTYIYQLLLKADSVNALTATGKKLKEKIWLLEKIEKKNFKSISSRGKQEQQGIAGRMFINNKAVFIQPNPVINIAYTKEIRTLQTCDAFLETLKTKISNPQISKKINDTTLRFYDLSPAYLEYKERGSCQQYLERVRSSLQYGKLAKEIVAQFFTGSFFKSIDPSLQDKFTTDLFGFIAIIYSLQNEIEDAGYSFADIDMHVFLTSGQLYILDKIDNAEDFLVKGPAMDIDGIQIKIAAPLLADFIKSTDQYIQTKDISVQLRFSHAETISPFATLLGFTGATESAKKIKNIGGLWQAAKIIPLSSNIQWILYQKKGTENYLVKFLLNEKEIAVKGLTTKTFPYYNWNDVRTFYLEKLKHFNTNLDTDYLQFLKEVK